MIFIGVHTYTGEDWVQNATHSKIGKAEKVGLDCTCNNCQLCWYVLSFKFVNMLL